LIRTQETKVYIDKKKRGGVCQDYFKEEVSLPHFAKKNITDGLKHHKLALGGKKRGGNHPLKMRKEGGDGGIPVRDSRENCLMRKKKKKKAHQQDPY